MAFDDSQTATSRTNHDPPNGTPQVHKSIDEQTGIMTSNHAAGPDRLILEGTPRERGLTHGEAFATEIEENVDRYLEVFAHYGADEESVYDDVETFVGIIESENPDYAEEMVAIAEGADLDVEDVTLLNARYEVTYGAYADAAAESDDPSPGNGVIPDGCTAFGAQPEITANGHTIVGQNWDWIPSIHTFVMDLRREEGTNLVAMTEAGIVGGKIGLNDRGIGMLLNGLISARDGERPYCKPYHVRFREALDAERLDRAIEPFLTADRANSANVLLAHAEGEMIDLELTPTRTHHLYPTDGLLTHANHFETTGVDSQFETIVPHTLCRAPRLRRLLSGERISIDRAKAALRDHFGKPASICSHVDESLPKPEWGRTNGSFLIDLTDRRMLATDGPPCESRYVSFEVED